MVVGQNGKESDCTVFFGRILRLASYVQGGGKGKEWGEMIALQARRGMIHSLIISTSW